ncbi:MAG: type II toxin-antitoxin system VapC family toxin [Acidobacteria bacterium]|nr:type II toxin-antitoxin system VapC family toxin [Acidobacteriota bacterium]
MKYLLDTCTISEVTKNSPDRNVVSWYESREETRLYLSVITVGEIERGIYGLPRSRKRTRLEKWFYDEVIPGFHGRILDIGLRTMATWAKLAIDLRKMGIVRPSFDSLLEATSIEHNLILATRNVRNFQQSAATIFNPWDR